MMCIPACTCTGDAKAQSGSYGAVESGTQALCLEEPNEPGRSSAWYPMLSKILIAMGSS